MISRKFLLPLFLVAFILIFISAQSPFFSPVNQLQAEEMTDNQGEETTPEPTKAPENEYIGSDMCGACHSDVYDEWVKTVHAKLPEGRYSVETGCESCHGPGGLHAEEGGDPTLIKSFKELSPQESSEICYECHRGTTAQIEWHSSEHYMGDVGCNDCHNVHKEHTKGMLKKEDPELCFECHPAQQIEAKLPSHHPVNPDERGITFNCSTCHNPHESMLMDKTEYEFRDQCLTCHGDKSGPFMFEHTPVAENCLSCHHYLGSEFNNLLQFNEPFLCLQCHDGIHVYSDTNGNEFPHAFTGAFDSVTGKFYTQCTSCHIQIHGSDEDDLLLR